MGIAVGFNVAARVTALVGFCVGIAVAVGLSVAVAVGLSVAVAVGLSVAVAVGAVVGIDVAASIRISTVGLIGCCVGVSDNGAPQPLRITIPRHKYTQCFIMRLSIQSPRIV